jgi:hypothetical protein
MKLLTIATPKKTRKPKQIGGVIYRGPSQLDGEDIVVILTGIKQKSSNAKTGAMVQAWILRADQNPYEAVQSGADSSICGDCVHRNSSCYVVVAQAPLQVYKAWKRGRYADWTQAFPARTLRGKRVRLGAYGDPAAVPFSVWRRVFEQKLAGWTGYTHQWHRPEVTRLRNYVMASVDSEDEALEAWHLGWRTFRVRTSEDALIPGAEAVCPASEEAGKRSSCDRCGLCEGQATEARSIAIVSHGYRKGNF